MPASWRSVSRSRSPAADASSAAWRSGGASWVRDHDQSSGIRDTLLACLRILTSKATAATWTTVVLQNAVNSRRPRANRLRFMGESVPYRGPRLTGVHDKFNVVRSWGRWRISCLGGVGVVTTERVRR
jgi:hypothetical protein